MKKNACGCMDEVLENAYWRVRDVVGLGKGRCVIILSFHNISLLLWQHLPPLSTTTFSHLWDFSPLALYLGGPTCRPLLRNAYIKV